MRAIIANTKESDSNTKTTLGSDISELVAKIATVASDDSFHTKTVAQIKREYGIVMSRSEDSRWRKYRNQVLRDQKMQEAKRRKAEQDEKREKVTFSLLKLTNKQLCKKIIQLEHANRKPGVKGKDLTPQLVKALALHTQEEIEQIYVQIQSFTDEQKENARHAISIIIGIRNAERINQRDSVLISQLTDNDLRSEFSELYNSPATKSWPPLFEKILLDKLKALGKKQTVLDFLHRIERLRTSREFTQEIKDSVLECINTYIAKN